MATSHEKELQDTVPQDHAVIIDGGDPNLDSLLPDTITKKKKKKRRKPQSQRGLNKPTGMEQFYADSPMTPAQYDEIKEIYGSDVLFLDRILTAIQRFERTRKLTPERRDVFYKWLRFGSIVVGSNQFAGLNAQEAKDADQDQLAELKSRVQIPDELRDDLETINTGSPKYAVDFLACTRAYFSYHAALDFGFENKERVVTSTTTVERFMDYLLQQEVCPEYNDEVLQTRNFCRDATEELWNVQQAKSIIPGEFNRACSTLFGGYYSKNFTATQPEWSEDTQEGPVYVGLTDEEASQIFGLAMSTVASDGVYEKYLEYTTDGRNDLAVVRTITDEGFEIIKLKPPDQESQHLYLTQAKDYRPLGQMIAKPWSDPYAAPEDLTEAEVRALRALREAEQDVYVFFIEGELMQYLQHGQKMLATIKQMNCGVWFFEECTTLYPSFETYIMNELMLSYKAPRTLQRTSGRQDKDHKIENETTDIVETGS